MAKCRGCGDDTREYEGGPGWMHYRCEIDRLQGLLDEANSFIEALAERIPAKLVDIANGDVQVTRVPEERSDDDE